MICTYLVDMNRVCIPYVWCFFLAYIPWVCKKCIYIHNMGMYILGMCIPGICILGMHILGMYELSICILGMYTLGYAQL
jgi:hypothetical protein